MATRQVRLGPSGRGDRHETTIESRADGKERCPSCNEWYKRLSQHWSTGSCSYPPISDYKMELLKGMIMGDGHLYRHGSNPYLWIGMINKTFLKALEYELGWVANSVRKERDAPQVAQGARNGLGAEVQASDTHDYYCLTTISHPLFDRFSDWYASDEIRYPRHLSVKPPSLLTWYISDGYLNFNSDMMDASCSVRFTSANESERPAAIVDALEEHSFTVCHSDDKFALRVDDTEDFFDLIGHDPVVGFSYKWEYGDIERYQEMKDLCERAHTTQTLE